jgi:hypothetical protein
MFVDAANSALVQMQFNQGYARDGFEVQRNGFQMEGARAFLSILMNLTTPPEEAPKRMAVDNLDHTI